MLSNPTASASSSSSALSANIITPNVSRNSLSHSNSAPSALHIRRSPRSSPTVATSSLMVLSSSLHGLTLVDKAQNQPQTITAPQPQCHGAHTAGAAPPSPPASNDNSLLLKTKRDSTLTLPSMRRTKSKRPRRKSTLRVVIKPITKAQTQALFPTPPLSIKPSSELNQHPEEEEEDEENTRQLPQKPKQQQQQQDEPAPQPQPTKKTTRPRRTHPFTQHQFFWMDQQRCLISPVGICGQPSEHGSIYCVLHSCRALLADSTTCNGAVHHPRQSRVCSSGYHKENTRAGYLEELLTNRAEYDAQRQATREEEWANSAAFFRKEFGEACSPSPYYDPQPAQTQAKEIPKPQPLTRCISDLGLIYEPVWGGGADRYWVGQWRWHQSSQ